MEQQIKYLITDPFDYLTELIGPPVITLKLLLRYIKFIKKNKKFKWLIKGVSLYFIL